VRVVPGDFSVSRPRRYRQIPARYVGLSDGYPGCVRGLSRSYLLKTRRMLNPEGKAPIGNTDALPSA